MEGEDWFLPRMSSSCDWTFQIVYLLAEETMLTVRYPFTHLLNAVIRDDHSEFDILKEMRRMYFCKSFSCFLDDLQESGRGESDSSAAFGDIEASKTTETGNAVCSQTAPCQSGQP